MWVFLNDEKYIDVRGDDWVSKVSHVLGPLGDLKKGDSDTFYSTGEPRGLMLSEIIASH